MTVEELNHRLTTEPVVPLPAEQWAELTAHFQEVERHFTFVAGDLIIVRGEAGLVAVERPSPDQRVLRRLANEDQAREFVRERLEVYERMWDGCGCKVDYFGSWPVTGY